MFDLDRLRRMSFIARLDFHPEIGSTNSRGLELAAQDGGPFPILVLAELQSSGRGRGANRWWSADGALTFSLVLDSTALRLPAQQWPQLSLATGLAVAEAIEELLPSLPVQVKWPNDVFAAGKKICGVLIESPSASRGRVVVGIGVNVQNSFAATPPDLRQRAAALCDLHPAEFDLTEVLARILASLKSRWETLAASGFTEIAAEYRRRFLLQDRLVTLESAGQTFTGVCLGIDDGGGLILQSESRRSTHAAGSVVEFI